MLRVGKWDQGSRKSAEEENDMKVVKWLQNIYDFESYNYVHHFSEHAGLSWVGTWGIYFPDAKALNEAFSW